MKKLTRKEGGRDRTGREKEGREERRGGGGRERGVREAREAKEDRKEEELFHLQLLSHPVYFQQRQPHLPDLDFRRSSRILIKPQTLTLFAIDMWINHVMTLDHFVCLNAQCTHMRAVADAIHIYGNVWYSTIDRVLILDLNNVI